MPLGEKSSFSYRARPQPIRVANGFLHSRILPDRTDMHRFRSGFLPALKDGASAREIW